MQLHQEFFISGILTTPEHRWQHWKPEMLSEGAAVIETASLQIAHKAYQKKCCSARAMIDDRTVLFLLQRYGLQRNYSNGLKIFLRSSLPSFST
jgi:hypothetical protein